MKILKIELIGEISLKIPLDRIAGFEYDIPFDPLDIPYLPLRRMLYDEGFDMPPGVNIGFAFPCDYLGFTQAALRMKQNIPKCEKFIRRHFTKERFFKEKGYSVRSLKSGQVFFAGVFFDESDTEKLKNALAAINHIGFTDDLITGEVKIELKEDDFIKNKELKSSDLCRYTSIDIAMTALTPSCFYTPYADGAKTSKYIPGEVIREELKHGIGENVTIDWGRIICSHGYISDETERLFPVPSCVSVVKLDKDQLRYRLSPGKDPKLAEQDVTLKDAYTGNILDHLVQYTCPQTQRFLSEDGIVYDTLSPGQTFQTTVYGSDEEIRAIAGHINDNPLCYLGDLSNEGCGLFLRKVYKLNEDAIPSEYLVNAFDLCLVSHTLILNDEGMPAQKAEDLLSEIEYKLGISGKLKITGKYTNVYIDSSRNRRWDLERTSASCFAAGSVLRLEAAGEPVDISKIRHCFIGERTNDGYGEIMCWPSKDMYYRVAEQLAPVRYAAVYSETTRSLKIAADFISEIIRMMIRSKIHVLAEIDKNDYAQGKSPDDIVPMEILRMYQHNYDPLLSIETMITWYEEFLREG